MTWWSCVWIKSNPWLIQINKSIPWGIFQIYYFGIRFYKNSSLIGVLLHYPFPTDSAPNVSVLKHIWYTEPSYSETSEALPYPWARTIFPSLTSKAINLTSVLVSPSKQPWLSAFSLTSCFPILLVLFPLHILAHGTHVKPRCHIVPSGYRAVPKEHLSRPKM